MQQRNVHFCRQRAGIKLLNHFHRCSGVARAREQINVAAVDAPGTVATATAAGTDSFNRASSKFGIAYKYTPTSLMSLQA